MQAKVTVTWTPEEHRTVVEHLRARRVQMDKDRRGSSTNPGDAQKRRDAQEEWAKLDNILKDL